MGFEQKCLFCPPNEAITKNNRVLKHYIAIVGLVIGMIAGTLIFQLFTPNNLLSSSISDALISEEDELMTDETDTLEVVEDPELEDETTVFVSIKTEKDLFTYLGLPVCGYSIHQDMVQKNEGLGQILTNCNVSYPLVDAAITNSKSTFNHKNIKPDQSYWVLCNEEQKARFWVYEESPHNYVVIDFRGQPHVYSCHKEIERSLKLATGVVYGSLHATLSNNHLNPALATELSNIFAYSIDFFKLQKGDKFKAIYEEILIDGEPIGMGEVKAAYFEHRKEVFYAFPYDQDGKVAYFNEEGKSLKKAFLKSPLKFTRISSKYSKKRFHPILKYHKPHLGTDYAAPKGTPIMTIGDGTVLEASHTRGNGKYVKIKHNGTYTTQYLHLSKFAKGIKRGARVHQGQVIGYVGSTGLATGPHLCFRFWKNGKQVDPYKEKTPRADPIGKKYVEQYKTYADSLKVILDGLKYQVQTEDVMAM